MFHVIGDCFKFSLTHCSVVITVHLFVGLNVCICINF
jgi:hypothetical protein